MSSLIHKAKHAGNSLVHKAKNEGNSLLHDAEKLDHEIGASALGAALINTGADAAEQAYKAGKDTFKTSKHMFDKGANLFGDIMDMLPMLLVGGIALMIATK